MPDNPAAPPPTTLPPPAALTSDLLRRQVRRAIMPVGPDGPGRSLLERLVLVAVLCSDRPTAKSLSNTVGVDQDVIENALGDLLAVGAIIPERGTLVVTPDADDPAADARFAEWHRVESAAGCSTCGAAIGRPCTSRWGYQSSPHAARRKAALTEAP